MDEEHKEETEPSIEDENNPKPKKAGLMISTTEEDDQAKPVDSPLYNPKNL